MCTRVQSIHLPAGLHYDDTNKVYETSRVAIIQGFVLAAYALKCDFIIVISVLAGL